MKRILLAILTIISIFVITSCGKKKVLTKRTMDDFYDDFTFSQDETGQNQYKLFKGYSSTEKTLSNEFSSLSNIRYTRVVLYTTKKVKIEGFSYTVYNKSTDEKISVSLPTDEGFLRPSKDVYFLTSGNMLNDYRTEVNPGEELECSAKYSNLVINKKIYIEVFFGLLSNDSKILESLLRNGGIYNFKIDYSAYI